EALGVVLAHAEQSTATQLHAHLAHEHARLEPLLPAVRRHHGPEERAGRLEVVVVAVHAAGGQALGLLGREDPEAAGDVETGALADRRYDGEHLLHDALVGAAHGEHDAE